MHRLFLILSLAAAVAPIAWKADSPAPIVSAFPGWPSHFEGRKLEPLALTKEEENFATTFPGRMARFFDGARHLLLRWVPAPDRRVHPAVECFLAWGYLIEPLPPRKDGQDRIWGSWRMTQGGNESVVTEIVIGPDGRCWSDISAWYWDALFAESQSGWLIVTVTEHAAKEAG